MADYTCEQCKYSTKYKSVMDKHIASKKHVEKQNVETATKYSHICSHCTKSYTTHSGLWKHQKTCEKQAPAAITFEKIEETSHVPTTASDSDSLMEHMDLQTRIKLKIIKILLEHVDRDELNNIIDEMYDNK